ncbi:MAG TPA: ORF6N domain-containing protein [Chthoniobacterales bacterium]|nr:ORF6N domain-containing protein [Chthoniobacterales bacterium]
MSKEIIPIERIARAIYLLRGQKVLLDFDLAALYGVATRVLNQAVKRNAARFPHDFMFQLSREETRSLRSQIVTLNEQPAQAEEVAKNRSQFVTGSLKPSKQPRRQIGFHVREKSARYRAGNGR